MLYRHNMTPWDASRVRMQDWMIYYQSLQEQKTDLFMQIAHLRNDLRGVTGNDLIDLSGFIPEAERKEAERLTEEETREIKDSWAGWYESDATC